MNSEEKLQRIFKKAAKNSAILIGSGVAVQLLPITHETLDAVRDIGSFAGVLFGVMEAREAVYAKILLKENNSPKIS